MTVYAGRTHQTSALKVWGVWVSMRDFHAATVRYNRELLETKDEHSTRNTGAWDTHVSFGND
jgi:hypothetical protein